MSKNIHMPVPQRVWANLKKHLSHTESNDCKPRIIIAYSGGKDSHVLLHALSTLKCQYPDAIQLEAWHVNHGLSPNAETWRKHCQDICRNLNIKFKFFEVKIERQSKQSLEELARNARYQIFKQNIQTNDILLTAHTQNDQAETVLMHLLRGSGVLGLSGIPVKTNWDKGQLLRPMLDIHRETISEYEALNELIWIEDESNQDTRFLRNTMRHEILPLLKKSHPSIVKNLARSARLCSDANHLLTEYVEPELKCMQVGNNQINLALLKQYSKLKIRALLRLWFKKNNLNLPSEKKLSEIIEQMLFAKTDRCPQIHWGNHTIRRYHDMLYLSSFESKKTVVIREKQRLWDLSKPLEINNQSWLATPALGQGLRIPEEQCIEVKFRGTGDRCRILGENLTRKLKHILQDLKIPTWERADTPCFFVEGFLVAVGEHIVSEYCKNIEPQTPGWVLTKQKVN